VTVITHKLELNKTLTFSSLSFGADQYFQRRCRKNKEQYHARGMHINFRNIQLRDL